MAFNSFSFLTSVKINKIMTYFEAEQIFYKLNYNSLSKVIIVASY